MYIQGVESVYDLVWTDGYSYRDIFHQNEVEQSKYNFDLANIEELFHQFDAAETACELAIENHVSLPAYEQILKASHLFNLLDARQAISVTERARYIGRVRNMSRQVAQAYYESRKALGFPRGKSSQKEPKQGNGVSS